MSKLKGFFFGLALVLLAIIFDSSMEDKMPPDIPLSRGERLVLLTTLLFITLNLLLLTR